MLRWTEKYQETAVSQKKRKEKFSRCEPQHQTLSNIKSDRVAERPQDLQFSKCPVTFAGAIEMTWL